MDEELEVRQQQDNKNTSYAPIQINPYDTHHWHKTDYYGGTKIQIRSKSSDWSYGSVDLNELGNSVLMLPQRGWFRGSANRDAVVAHVEVSTDVRSDDNLMVWSVCLS